MPKQLLSSEVPGPPTWERNSREKHQGKDLKVKWSSDSCSLSRWLQDALAALGKLHIHLCTSKTVSPSFCRRLHLDGQQTLAAPPTT